MTPEEIVARRILADAFQYYSRGPLSPTREAELRDLIAAALREAIAAEREACAAVANTECVSCFAGAPDGTPLEYRQGGFNACTAIARAIRARSEP